MIIVLFMAALFSSCDKCKNVECATPPPVFEFEILDKQSNENLFTSEVFNQHQIRIENQEGKEVLFNFISEGDRNTIKLLGIGAKTEKIYYTINIADEVIFDLKIDAERKKGACCDYTEVHSIAIENIEYSINKSTEVISIFVER